MVQIHMPRLLTDATAVGSPRNGACQPASKHSPFSGVQPAAFSTGRSRISMTVGKCAIMHLRAHEQHHGMGDLTELEHVKKQRHLMRIRPWKQILYIVIATMHHVKHRSPSYNLVSGWASQRDSGYDPHEITRTLQPFDGSQQSLVSVCVHCAPVPRQLQWFDACSDTWI